MLVNRSGSHLHGCDLMHNLTIIATYCRPNCKILCKKFLRANVIPRKGEYFSIRGYPQKVREVVHVLSLDATFEENLETEVVISDDFSSDAQKDFGVHDLWDKNLVSFDHVWVKSSEIDWYTLYKNTYDGTPPKSLNRNTVGQFEKNFCKRR